MRFKFVTQVFMKGLVVIVPIVAAVYVILWLVRDSESLVKGLVLEVVPESYYVPGLGIVLLAAAIFFIGLLMYPWLTRKVLDGVDWLLRQIPLFGAIYSPTRDLMDLLGGESQGDFSQVVLIKIPNTDIETLGFVTRQDLSDLPDGLAREDHVVVYVQWSSQVGGYCFIVPKDRVTPVAMTVEQGMRWALTAGISAPTKAGSSASPPEQEHAAG